MSSHSLIMAAAGSADSSGVIPWSLADVDYAANRFQSRNPYVSLLRESTFSNSSSRFQAVTQNGSYLLWSIGSILYASFLSTAHTFPTTISASGLDNLNAGETIRGVVFNAGGTLLLVITSSRAKLYTLTIAYSLVSATLTAQSSPWPYDPGSVYLPGSGPFIGLRGYALNSSSNGGLHINMSEAFTATGVTGATLSVFSLLISGWSMSLSNDGKLAYVQYGSPSTPESRVYQLGTAWDLTTLIGDTTSYYDTVAVNSSSLYAKVHIAVTSAINFAHFQTSNTVLRTYSTASRAMYSTLTGASITSPGTICFKPDGTKFFVLSRSNDTIYELSLSTPWDLRTAAFTAGRIFVTSGFESTPVAMAVSDAGDKVFVTGTTSDRVHSLTLSTPWSVNTATVGSSYLLPSINPETLWASQDGLHFYVKNSTTIRHYTLSAPWDILTVALAESVTDALYAGFFSGMVNSDGTQMVVTDFATDTLKLLTLPTPFVLTGATVVESISIVPPETNSAGIAISPDGVNFIVSGSTQDSAMPFINFS